MGFTRKIDPAIKLSPRENRLVTALQDLSGWAGSEPLCAVEFGAKKNWPLNARHIVSGALNSLQRKLEYHHSKVVLTKRGNGGRAGIEYKLSLNKEKA